MTIAASGGVRDVIREGIAGSTSPVRLLQIEIWLLFLFPARLRFEPLGAAGNPAILFAIGLFVLWSVSVLSPSISSQARCGPVRLVLAVFWLPILLSYLLMHLDPLPAEVTSVSDIVIVTLIAFTGVALYAAEGTRTTADLLRIIRTFVAGASVMCLVAILQSQLSLDLTSYVAKLPFLTSYGDGITLVARGSFERPAGTASHPIEMGVVAGLALALAIYLSLYDRAWPKLGRWSAVAVIGLGIPIAVSRSGLLVAIAVLAVFFAGATRWARGRALPVVTAMLATVFVIFPGMLGTLSQVDASIASRTDDYTFVDSTVASSLWFGHGPGWLIPEVRVLDNQYLLSLVETGIVGVCALLVMFGAIWVFGRGGRRRFADEGDRLLGQMLAAAGLGIIVAALTYDGLSFPMFKASVALFLGLAGRYWRLARAAENPASDTGSSGGTTGGARKAAAERHHPRERAGSPDDGQPRGVGRRPGGNLPATG